MADKDFKTLVAKLDAQAQSFSTKLNAGHAAVSRARDSFKVKAPADATPDEVRTYDERCKRAVKAIAYTDGYMATLQAKVKELRKLLKVMGE